ncbi:MAG TPA: adenosylcobinamide-GDP ribazoletransferase [Acidobacteriaceae bacterium]|nr:adenosylcobinamide-GDP ribazoletransferase [Acidobacteriaceae bacterium]
MSKLSFARQIGTDFLTAVQFLTRIPVPRLPYDSGSLSRATQFFPAVGMLLGAAAAVLYRLLSLHLSRLVTSLLVVTFLVFITGCLHEDGLADTADGFGGGRSREQILAILKDSRIGSYGGAALALSLFARVLLLASMPLAQVPRYLIAAHVLCRWTTLPLSYYLAPARSGKGETTAGQGARIARLVSRKSLMAGSLFMLAICLVTLRTQAAAAIAVAFLVTLLTGTYFQRRIGGVTGDCFGATNQLAEIAVYLTGAWLS